MVFELMQFRFYMKPWKIKQQAHTTMNRKAENANQTSTVTSIIHILWTWMKRMKWFMSGEKYAIAIQTVHGEYQIKRDRIIAKMYSSV